MDKTLLTLEIDAILPQTQCTRCGYPSCREYAQAIAEGKAEINQCPPGGDAGITKLAHLLKRPEIPLNPTNGVIKPRQLAIIDEEVCIGCTLCIKACPVDAILGANKMMHTVISNECTGCDLCVPVCPVDCITMVDDPNQDWDGERKEPAKRRYEMHIGRKNQERVARDARLAQQAELLRKVRVMPNEDQSKAMPSSSLPASKSDFIAQILAKAKQK